MQNTSNIIIIGCIGAPHGIKGWVKITSYTRPSTNIVSYSPWLLEIKQQWQTLEPTAYELHTKQVIAKLPNYDTREQVQLLTHTKIAIYRDQLPELADSDPHYYWQDLIGLTVITHNGEELGKVDQLIATGANDVLVVQGKTKHLIPFVLKHFILEVNLSKKQIIVDWDVNNTST